MLAPDLQLGFMPPTPSGILSQTTSFCGLHAGSAAEKTMANVSNTNPNSVLIADELLIGLLSPLGYRSEWGALLGYLKIAGNTAVTIMRSELVFLDTEGNTIETRTGAFGLGSGAKYSGPFSGRLSDDSRRPAAAVAAKWRLNDMEVASELSDPSETALRVIYLPLLVASSKDPLVVVTLVNRTAEILNVAEGTRSAVLFVDGNRCPSNTGGHWDGSYGLHPGRATTRQFSLDDFSGAPQSGIHNVSFTMLGLISESETVNWHPGRSR